MKQIIATFFTLLFFTVNYGQVRLPKYISDGMVLQRDQPIKIWGYASPDEKVTVQFSYKEYQAIAKKDSIWQVMIPSQKAGGPHEITIKGSNYLCIKNILFGDVWVCGGQSNMETTMDRLQDKYPEVYQKAKNKMIRQFFVPKEYDFNSQKKDYPSGTWQEISPENMANLSGVAYFFAARIHTETNIPIGIINAAMGGSNAQSWISENSLKNFPKHFETALKYKNKDFVDSILSANSRNTHDWFKAVNSTDEGIKLQWQKMNIDRTDWRKITLPSLWKDAGINLKPGAIWLNRSFELNQSQAQLDCRLFLGCIVDADSVYVNGHFVGTTSYQYPPRKYKVSSSILKEGKNEITIRVLDQNGQGGFVVEKPYALFFPDKTKVSLEGEWFFKVGTESEKIPPTNFVAWKPLGLYNGMLSPLFEYSVKGVIWYQGEGNTWNPDEYFDLMKWLIADWRKGFNNPDLPFYFVQLVNFMKAKANPAESNWAALRQQQLNTLKIKNTGMAVGIDVGEWNELHPHNKKDIGERLALHALKNQYGQKKLTVSGPIIKKFKVRNKKVLLDFYYVNKGIRNVAELKHFELAGNDKKFVKAKATIKGKSVIIESDEIITPKYVRYAWADNPEGVNFFNEEGLPASPFELKLDY